MTITHKWVVAAREWVEQRPRLALFLAALSFLFIFLPQWISSVWALFSGDPFLPSVAKGMSRLLISTVPLALVTGPIGLVTLAVILYLLISGKRTSSVKFSNRFLALITVALSLVLAPILWVWLKTPSVYPPFQSAYNAHKGLGEPIAKETQLPQSYIAEYMHATAIWAYDRRLFILDSVPNSGDSTRTNTSRWTEYINPKPDPDPENDPFYIEDCSRILFSKPATPGGSHPPHGGVAALWTKKPTEWKEWQGRMGWRDWHCDYLGDVYIQEFQGGLIIGPFSKEKTSQSVGQVFVLTTKDQQWFPSEPTGAPTIPVCRSPDKTKPCPSGLKIEPLP